MIAYFDTSAIIPLLIDEPGSGRAREQWLVADHIVTATLARVEARAALAMAARASRIDADQHRAAVASLPGLFAQVAQVPVDDDLVLAAADLAEARALRAYDAMHLAAAIRSRAPEVVVVAGDGALLSAAAAEGLSIVDTS